jgi:hypothetical protein
VWIATAAVCVSGLDNSPMNHICSFRQGIHASTVKVAGVALLAPGSGSLRFARPSVFSLRLVTSSPMGMADEIQIPDGREFGVRLLWDTIMFPGHLRGRENVREWTV